MATLEQPSGRRPAARTTMVAALAVVVLTFVVTGCAGAADPAVTDPGPDAVTQDGTDPAATGPDPDVVAHGEPFELSTHCGIDEVVHDDRWYERADGPLDMGGGNPPPGWDNPTQDGWLWVDGDTAVFTDDSGHREEFLLRPGATEAKSICS